MRDYVTEELISAYIDGELTGDERQLVEKTLAESAEHRRLLEQLQGLRASFEQLPRYHLPEDFHQRVLERTAALQPMAGGETRTGPSSRKRWWQAAAYAAIGVAAVFALIMLLNPGPAPPPVVEGPDLPPPVPDESWGEESFVYYLPSSPGSPVWRFVVHLEITPQGQDNNTFQDAFRRVGVLVDPDLAVDEELEELVLGSRVLGDVKVDREDEGAEVDLFYVICETPRAELVLRDLMQLAKEKQEIAGVQFDVLFTTRELEMMYRLNETSRTQFASRESPTNKRSLVHRLAFRVKLNLSPLSGLGTIPTPSLRAEVAPEDETAGANSEPPPSAAIPGLPPVGDAASPDFGEIMARSRAAPTEILFVLKKLKDPVQP